VEIVAGLAEVAVDAVVNCTFFVFDIITWAVEMVAAPNRKD
jgi:hypothetical protein